MSRRNKFEQGSANGWMIGAIASLVLFLIAGALAIWVYVMYIQEKSDVDGQIQLAETKARSDQSEIERKKYAEEAKNPRIEFVGPSEYGRVSFMYPKAWSVYVDKDGSDRGDYKAYFHPGTVPSVSNKASRFAFRVEVLNSDFDKVLSQYSSLLKKGDLVSSSVEFNGDSATRIDGAFSDDLRGSVVLMKVRDKTIRFSTDADTFKPDFETVLGTVKYVE